MNRSSYCIETPINSSAFSDSKFPPGLSSVEAARRQATEGYNELAAEQGRSLPRIALEILRDPMFLLLLGAGAVYLAIGNIREALVLLVFVLVIIAVTILQESRTEKALQSLRVLSSPRALVIRDKSAIRIPGREVVRGDVLIINEGARIPADGSVLLAHELEIDESLLTGESTAVTKQSGPEPSERPQAYAGTLVTRGHGLLEVTAIGSATELGHIGKSLQIQESEHSPLQQEIDRLTRRVAAISIGFCLMVAGLYLLLRHDLLGGLLAGITLAMAMLPQEFSVILIVFFAFGARRIADARVLTRRLSAIETLGETTVLCVDKTGTLTENRMSVAALDAGGQEWHVRQHPKAELPEAFRELLEYAVLASEIEPHDPMEQALHRLARDYLANTEYLHSDWSLAYGYELSPELRAMSHLWKPPQFDHHIVAAKGAPEAIADLCHLGPSACSALMQRAETLAKQGLRVLAIAKAIHAGGSWPKAQHDFDFELLGLVGLVDPIRPEVPAAIEQCQQAGIRVVMITGDHPITAQSIAEQAGIDHRRVLSGDQIADIKPIILAAEVATTNVFARISPHQKLTIVQALKANGEIVAMTGDGVNDAPALKAAHIGIAMGKRGTDIAREAASLVLLDDDFSAIVSAIRQGRRIFDNLRQAMMYTIAVHVPIVLLSIGPLLFGLPLMLAPVHITFMELVISPSCSVVFEAEKENARIMLRPPRSPDEPLISSAQLSRSLLLGAVAAASIMSLYWWGLTIGLGIAQARTIAFIALISASIALLLSILPRSENLRRKLARGNRTIYWVISAALIGLSIAVGIPGVAVYFGFTAVPLRFAAVALAMGIILFFIFELAKRLANLAEYREVMQKKCY